MKVVFQTYFITCIFLQTVSLSIVPLPKTRLNYFSIYKEKLYFQFVLWREKELTKSSMLNRLFQIHRENILGILIRKYVVGVTSTSGIGVILLKYRAVVSLSTLLLRDQRIVCALAVDSWNTSNRRSVTSVVNVLSPSDLSAWEGAQGEGESSLSTMLTAFLPRAIKSEGDYSRTFHSSSVLRERNGDRWTVLSGEDCPNRRGAILQL